MRYDYSPNTVEFVRLMDLIDYYWFNHEILDNVPDMDIGQYVRRLTEEKTGIPEGDDPSDEALEILRELVRRYPKKEREKDKDSEV
jgi:hypothetical protein